jgi:uncharacterized membrane protein YhhN
MVPGLNNNIMTRITWIILYGITLAVYVVAIEFSNHDLQYICKPLLMPLLLIYFFTGTKSTGSSKKVWIVSGLLFSWSGDVLLMFQPKDEIFFLFGLSAFLLAHIFYIIFFHRIRVKENIKGNPWLMVIVVIYYAALLTLLSPSLGTMKWPVRIYGIVISFMFMLAMHMLYIKKRNTGLLMMLGALLFVISDSMLAIDKFYHSFVMADVLIIVTYALAQLFIVEGAVKYIRETITIDHDGKN